MKFKKANKPIVRRTDKLLHNFPKIGEPPYEQLYMSERTLATTTEQCKDFDGTYKEKLELHM